MVLMLVGNKCDIPLSERQVSKEEAIALSEKFKIPYVETSAL
jgi:hypothetical protein